MARERKQLLIVDDTEIERTILKSILSNEFDVLEANSGNMAFEYITTRNDQLDGILLDIAMPNIDGFDVLRFMEDKQVTNIPVFLVTAETTRDNVERAAKYHIAEFIGKPFDREDILRRLRSRLGVIPEYNVTNENLKITRAYISDLETVYQAYLANFGRSDDHYQVMVDLMRFLLNGYNKGLREDRLPEEAIELISKAAYFCDIGEMLIPDKRLQNITEQANYQELQQNHTRLGSNLIRLNRDKGCEYFVEICSSMCLHHHERFDGKGYPDQLRGNNNSVYNQMCRLVDDFDKMRSKFYGEKTGPVKFVIKRLRNEVGTLVSPRVYSLLEECEPHIIDYFMKRDL